MDVFQPEKIRTPDTSVWKFYKNWLQKDSSPPTEGYLTMVKPQTFVIYTQLTILQHKVVLKSALHEQLHEKERPPTTELCFFLEKKILNGK